MSKIWHRIVPTLAVGGLLAAGSIGAGAIPAAASPAAGLTATISAQSQFAPITGDVIVLYDAGKYGNVTISGQVSGATADDEVTATLYAQQFPFKKPATPIAEQTLLLGPGTATPYGFTATPTLATKYFVEVFASGTTAPVGQSAPQVVYVTDNESAYGIKKCTRPVCHETIRLYTAIPASAYRHEAAKRWYVYFALNLSPTRAPAEPKFVYLDNSIKVSAVKRISSTKFERTISLSFTIGNDGYYWSWLQCTKDSEAKDGIGLPGSHGCGAKRVSSRVVYLG
jgi:hypothetical protein